MSQGARGAQRGWGPGSEGHCPRVTAAGCEDPGRLPHPARPNPVHIRWEPHSSRVVDTQSSQPRNVQANHHLYKLHFNSSVNFLDA